MTASQTPELMTLANGMRFVADPIPAFETAAVGIFVQAGTIDESAAESGVAHLLEHMAFKGAGPRNARQIAEDIEAVGGYLNADTSYQRTGYYARVLKADAALAIDILADIVTAPWFAPEELEKEKEVVVQEIGEAADTPDDAVGDLLQSLAYPGQSLGRPILGSVESVRSHDPARLKAFVKRRYGKRNLIAVASGGVDPEALGRLLEQRIAFPDADVADARPHPRYVGGLAHDDRDIEQTHIAIAFPGVGLLHEDREAVRVFAEIFGGGMSSRLFQTIREDRGLAYSVYASAECYDADGLVSVYAGTDEANAEEAVRLIRDALQSLASEVTDRELARAKAVLSAGRMMQLESPAARAERAAMQVLVFGAARSPAEATRELERVRPDDVRRCARRALEAGPPSLAVVGPAQMERLQSALRV